MTNHKIGTREEWLAARLLTAEKEFTRRSDELAKLRQELLWVRIDKYCRFETVVQEALVAVTLVALLLVLTLEGQGIDPEIYPRLFTKFAAKSDTGTGLGLFISKSFVEAHGGKIWAENNHDFDGHITGATFTFSIPLSKVEQDKREQN